MSKYINKNIETERLVIGQYSEKDLDRVACGLKSNYICKSIGANPIFNIDRVKEYIEDNRITFESKKCRSTRLAIRLKDKEFIGNIGVYKRDEYIELGWWLLDNYRHQGYMSEALGEVIKHLKSYNNKLRIRANIYKFNKESQRLAERIGMNVINHYTNDAYIEYEI